MTQYSILLENPSVGAYQTLRTGAGLSPNSDKAVELAIPNSLFSVQILFDNNPIGMGRVIGDGGCFYQVVDIAVLPEHQRQGIGTMIMREIARFIDDQIPETAYVSLIADDGAERLYAKFGFQATAPKSVGMALKRRPALPPVAG